MLFHVFGLLFNRSNRGGQNLNPVNNLCHSTNRVEQIRVTEEIDIGTLSFLDKLLFQKKTLAQSHHEYLNTQSNAVQDISFASHENMYPQWWTPPVMSRSDESGIKSFHDGSSPHFTGGWPGGIVDTTAFGVYKEENGLKFYEQLYSDVALEAYQDHNQQVSLAGFLYKYLFAPPNAAVLLHLENEGCDVMVEGPLIVIEYRDLRLVWDVNEHIFATQITEDSAIVSTTSMYYEYVTDFNDYLLARRLEVIPGTFSNGDCYETVIETFYTDYAANCGPPSIGTRSENDEEPLMAEQDMSLHPNPVNDQLQVRIPVSMEQASVLRVLDLNGSIIMERRLAPGQEQYSLNVRDLPNGMYLISVNQGSARFTSKFVKQ